MCRLIYKALVVKHLGKKNQLNIHNKSVYVPLLSKVTKNLSKPIKNNENTRIFQA